MISQLRVRVVHDIQPSEYTSTWYITVFMAYIICLALALRTLKPLGGASLGKKVTSRVTYLQEQDKVM